jgi:hypothetical protein
MHRECQLRFVRGPDNVMIHAVAIANLVELAIVMNLEKALGF